MTLLPPEPSGRHSCGPPMVKRTILLPLGPGAGFPYSAEQRAVDAARPRPGHVITEPPPVGSMWGCPVCGTVWKVIPGRDPRRGRLGGGYSAVPAREWIRAGWLTARRHRNRIAAGATATATARRDPAPVAADQALARLVGAATTEHINALADLADAGFTSWQLRVLADVMATPPGVRRLSLTLPRHPGLIAAIDAADEEG